MEMPPVLIAHCPTAECRHELSHRRVLSQANFGEKTLKSMFFFSIFLFYCAVFDASYKQLKIDIHLATSIQPKNILLFFHQYWIKERMKNMTNAAEAKDRP